MATQSPIHNTGNTLSCTCGRAAIEVHGAAMACTVCYCDTCQAGGHALEALTGAPPVLERDGGTGYVLFRRDRIVFARGTELLQPLKVDATATSRVYASCCNTAMAMQFNDARHWVCVYRDRFNGAAPPIEFRVCTKYKPQGVTLAAGVPAYSMYPPQLLLRLLAARLAMLFAPRTGVRNG